MILLAVFAAFVALALLVQLAERIFAGLAISWPVITAVLAAATLVSAGFLRVVHRWSVRAWPGNGPAYRQHPLTAAGAGAGDRLRAVALRAWRLARCARIRRPRRRARPAPVASTLEPTAVTDPRRAAQWAQMDSLIRRTTGQP